MFYNYQNNCLGDGAAPGMQIACTEAGWIGKNLSFYEWYYQEYPELIYSGIRLPVSMNTLKGFYVLDMQKRNLEPQESTSECYEALFSYLLGRLTEQINKNGRGWWELTVKNLPVAWKSTVEQISNPFGVPWYVWLIGGVAVFGYLRN